MTRADVIRELSDDDIVELLVWGCATGYDLNVPTCDEGCSDFDSGCALKCPHEKREKAVRDWLLEEVD